MSYAFVVRGWLFNDGVKFVLFTFGYPTLLALMALGAISVYSWLIGDLVIGWWLAQEPPADEPIG